MPDPKVTCVFTLTAGDYSDYGIVGVFSSEVEAMVAGEKFVRTHGYSSSVQISCYILGESEPVDRYDFNNFEPDRHYDWSLTKVRLVWEWGDRIPGFRDFDIPDEVAGGWVRRVDNHSADYELCSPEPS